MENTSVSSVAYYRAIRDIGLIVETGVSNGRGINSIVRMIAGGNRKMRRVVRYRAETILYRATRRLEEAQEDIIFSQDKSYTYNWEKNGWICV